LKYLIPIATALNVHVVELIYVCRRSNFDGFKVPTPQNTPTSSSSDAAVEHQQYLDLMTALQAIWRAKNSTTIPPSSLVVRKVCYEQVGVDQPLSCGVSVAPVPVSIIASALLPRARK
jgi:hypothetical protein